MIYKNKGTKHGTRPFHVKKGRNMERDRSMSCMERKRNIILILLVLTRTFHVNKKRDVELPLARVPRGATWILGVGRLVADPLRKGSAFCMLHTVLFRVEPTQVRDPLVVYMDLETNSLDVLSGKIAPSSR